MQSTSNESANHDEESESDGHGDVRGSFTAVMIMAAFFVATWFGVLAIAMVRR